MRGESRNSAQRAKKHSAGTGAVRSLAYIQTMTERQYTEVAKVLLHISDARTRARRAADSVEKDGADAHVVEALRESEHHLAELHRKLSQGTYYAVPEMSLRLAL